VTTGPEPPQDAESPARISGLMLSLDGCSPDVTDDAWVAPSATLVGAVTVRAQASIWFGAVLRADGDRIEIGECSNIQDGAILHADPGFPLTVGSRVSVGHGALVHGCTVEDEVLVGMGATVLNGARIGRGSLVAAGTVVLEGTDIAPGSLVAGVPGKVRRQLSEDEIESIHENASRYVDRCRTYPAQLRAHRQDAQP